ncbi:uncharacterized protein LAJ45_01902 [Morchella importuna]|uniref:t-SNARE coiled-coil homology domain-containing protein n=1 Tax=Morchella conica CCBAS932 TaxID=1392247 RepID=A0A3N4L222_9PEZI|nr:uncharacterized protein LAJ45_01902 [Morchella importuna]KAH8154134.1 hypothetical protein LAJ45_01902 [Morchella importuna]RPB16857.1 hypothetical protein P167DRAFT_570035 [Morchella conica CCBAS932]
MSEAYERERQNNARLDELASKVTSLRDVTINIYDNARDQHIIDDSSDLFDNFSSSLKQSTARITRMASSGTKSQTLKMAAVATGTIVMLYLVWGWFF